MDWGTVLTRPRKPLRYGFLFFLAALGCGQDNKLTPVQGQVFYQGKPLMGGTIVFTPDAERGGRGPLACGEIGSDGRYWLQTGDQAGVIPGWHRVTIAAPAPTREPGQTVTLSPNDLPRKYGDPEKSGLLREIQAGKCGPQDFYLE